jgi:hypothetical protein
MKVAINQCLFLPSYCNTNVKFNLSACNGVFNDFSLLLAAKDLTYFQVSLCHVIGVNDNASYEFLLYNDSADQSDGVEYRR